jgi:uncharacterized damage-inducible protein DinB
MALNQSLLPEFDMEMANTRKTLERVPDDKLAWRPHEKSMTMGRLAAHVTEVPMWGEFTLTTESFDVAPSDGPAFQPPPQPQSRKELLDVFDKGVASLRQALSTITDQDLMKPWSLKKGGQAIFTMPRVAVFRSFVMNHGIHHRAQLGVYLRLNNVPLPAIYGPSADEGAM